MVSGQGSQVRGRRSGVTGCWSEVTCQGVAGQVSQLLVRGRRLRSHVKSQVKCHMSGVAGQRSQVAGQRPQVTVQ